MTEHAHRVSGRESGVRVLTVVFQLISEVKWKLLSHVRLFVTPWTVQSMEFSRPASWSGWPFPFPVATLWMTLCNPWTTAHLASQSSTISQSLLTFTSINHWCHLTISSSAAPPPQSYQSPISKWSNWLGFTHFCNGIAKPHLLENCPLTNILFHKKNLWGKKRKKRKKPVVPLPPTEGESSPLSEPRGP